VGELSIIRWDNDGKGFIMPLKLCEKYSVFLCFRVVGRSINVALRIYPKRSKIDSYNGKIVFESLLDLNQFNTFIRALDKISSIISGDSDFSLVYELDKVISHLRWLRNYVGGGING